MFYVPHKPTCLTCLSAYLPSCFWSLRTFHFYMPYVPSFFYVPNVSAFFDVPYMLSFFYVPSFFYVVYVSSFFTWFTFLHFLSGLRFFIFYVVYVSSFFMWLTCLHFFFYFFTPCFHFFKSFLFLTCRKCLDLLFLNFGTTQNQPQQARISKSDYLVFSKSWSIKF